MALECAEVAPLEFNRKLQKAAVKSNRFLNHLPFGTSCFAVDTVGTVGMLVYRMNDGQKSK